MGKPREEPDGKDYFKDIHFLYDILGQLENIDEVKIFFKDLLTSSELRMFKKRWHIAKLIRNGLDIRSVANQTQSGIQTVLRVKKSLEEGHGGLILALERMEKSITRERENFIKSKRPKGGSKFVKGWFR